MPLQVRSIAASVAVISFFTIAVIGSIKGITPFTCSKRALVGAILTYTVATLAVKAINAILINAMINYKMNQQKQKGPGNENSDF